MIYSDKYKFVFFSNPKCASRTHRQLEFLTNKDRKMNIDFIGRFENLQKDFNQICKTINIPFIELPKLNSTSHDHYSKYNEETKKIVAEIFQKDIDYFGYKYEET